MFQQVGRWAVALFSSVQIVPAKKRPSSHCKGETNQSNTRESFFLANIRTFFPIRIFGQGMYYYAQ